MPSDAPSVLVPRESVTQSTSQEILFWIESVGEQAFQTAEHFVWALWGFGDGSLCLKILDIFSKSSHPDSTISLLVFDDTSPSRESLIKSQKKYSELPFTDLIQSFPPPLKGVFLVPWHDHRIRLLFHWGQSVEQNSRIDSKVDKWFIQKHNVDGHGFAPPMDVYDLRSGVPPHHIKSQEADEQKRPQSRNGSLPWFHRPVGQHHDKSMIVIGAGIAGCATAMLFAERGWKVTVIDKEKHPMLGVSGNKGAAIFTKLSPFDQPLNRFHHSAYFHAIRRLNQLFPTMSACGLLALLRGSEVSKMKTFVEDVDNPHFVQFCDPRRGSSVAGVSLDRASLFYPQSYLINPQVVASSLLAMQSVHFIPNHKIEKIQYEDQSWLIPSLDNLKASLLVVCAGIDTIDLSTDLWFPLKAIAGQLTYLPSTQPLQNLKTIISAESYLTPAIQGAHLIGATYRLHDRFGEVLEQDNQLNLRGVQTLLPMIKDSLMTKDGDSLHARAGVRACTNDYFPMIGPVPIREYYIRSYLNIKDGNRHTLYPPAQYHQGLYVNVGHGSKGFTQAWIAAELLYCLAEKEPLIMDRQLYYSLHPARFLIRQLKRGIIDEVMQ